MSDAGLWRNKLAEEVARTYARNRNVRAVVLAGSTSRGLADAHSDVEVDVFWAAPPSHSERLEPIERLSAEVIGSWPLEDDEWSDSIGIDGLRVDVSGFLVETMETYLRDVVDRAEVDLNKQLLLSHVHRGRALFDDDHCVPHWKQKTGAYPEALARAMVRAHLVPHQRWAQRHALSERNDLICLNELIIETLRTLLAALCGLNRSYLSHPSFKWFEAEVAQFELRPAEFSARARRVFRVPSRAAIAELEALLFESCDLIERWLPGAGAREAKRSFCEARPQLLDADLRAIVHRLELTSSVTRT